MLDATFISRDVLLLIQREVDDVHLAAFSLIKNQTTHIFNLPFSHPDLTATYIRHPAYNSTKGFPAHNLNWIGPDSSVDILPIRMNCGASASSLFVLSVLHILGRIRSNLDQAITIFEWDEWGPTTTRWLPVNQLINGGPRCVFGSRMIAFTHINLFNKMPFSTYMRKAHLVLLDFNQRLIRREKDDRRTQIITEDDTRRVVEIHDASEVCASYTGNVNVTTALPFRAVIDKRACSFYSLYIDSTTILAGKVSYSHFSLWSEPECNLTAFILRELVISPARRRIIDC